MAVNRYRRDGRPWEEPWHAARYRPGEPLADLTAVLGQLRPGAQAEVVRFQAGGSALAVFVAADPPRMNDQWLIIEPGAWLAANGKTGFAAKITAREMSRDWNPAGEPP